MEKRITIAIVTFNSLEYTKYFLKNLRQNVKVPYELVIVDNNSTDGTKDFLSRYSDAKIILNKRNLGFGGGNNQAFKKCRTEYFLGVNNDTVIFPGFVKHLLGFMDNHPKYGEIGVHSNCIGAKDPVTKKDINKEIKALERKGATPFIAFDRYFPDKKEFYDRFKNLNPGVQKIKAPPNFIGGWCFLVRKNTIKQIGGLFDRRFKVGFWEDVDLSWRIANTGLKVGLIRGAYIHHFNHVSFNSSKQKLQRSDHAISRRNSLEFAAKWSDEIRDVLKREFDKNRSLMQIMTKNFIFKVYFNRSNKEIIEFEKKLKDEFVIKPGVNFKDFLLEVNNERKA